MSPPLEPHDYIGLFAATAPPSPTCSSSSSSSPAPRLTSCLDLPGSESPDRGDREEDVAASLSLGPLPAAPKADPAAGCPQGRIPLLEGGSRGSSDEVARSTPSSRIDPHLSSGVLTHSCGRAVQAEPTPPMAAGRRPGAKARGGGGGAGRRSASLAADGSKRWGEAFLLLYMPFWLTLCLGVVVPFKLYERFTELEYLILGLLSTMPAFVIPLFLVGKADNVRNLKD